MMRREYIQTDYSDRLTDSRKFGGSDLRDYGF